MTIQAHLHIVAATAIAAALLMPSAAVAIDETTRSLARNLGMLRIFGELKHDLKAVLTPEMGFPDAHLRHWDAAVDAGFDAELLEADFVQALEDQLSLDARNAALAFDASPLGQKVNQLATSWYSVTDKSAALAAAQQVVEAASVQQNALFVDLFASQRAPELASGVMDVYFRLMSSAAEPVVGKQAADQWVSDADYLREDFVEDYFLTQVAVYGHLEQEQLKDVTTVIGTPQMGTYAEQTNSAFLEALEAAAQRLETAYSEAVHDQ